MKTVATSILDKQVLAPRPIFYQSNKTFLILLWIIAFFTSIAMSLLAVQRHYFFHTHSYDLGIETSVAWNTAFGRWFYDSIRQMNYLWDHFSPVYLLFTPLMRIFPSAVTLLVIQAAAIAFAIPAVGLLGLRLCHSKSISLFVCAAFLCCPYLTRVNTYDFHPVALAIPVLLWAIYFIETKRWLAFAVSVLLCFTLKEDMSFAIAGIGLSYLLINRHKILSIFLILLSAAVFLIVVLKIMPAFGDTVNSHIDRYSHLGSSLTQVLDNIFVHPFRTLKVLAADHNRLRTLFRVMMFSAFLPFFAPAAIVAMLPSILVHIASNYKPQINLSAQYSAAIIPFMFLGICAGIRNLRIIFRRYEISIKKQKKIFIIILTVLALAGFDKLPRYVAFRDINKVKQEHAVLAVIPPDSAVAAADYYVPHLVTRQNITMLAPPFEDTTRQAEYIVMDISDHRLWPCADEKTWLDNIEKLLQNLGFGLYYRRGDIILLKRGADSQANIEILNEIRQQIGKVKITK